MAQPALYIWIMEMGPSLSKTGRTALLLSSAFHVVSHNLLAGGLRSPRVYHLLPSWLISLRLWTLYSTPLTCDCLSQWPFCLISATRLNQEVSGIAFSHCKQELGIFTCLTVGAHPLPQTYVSVGVLNASHTTPLPRYCGQISKALSPQTTISCTRGHIQTVTSPATEIENQRMNPGGVIDVGSNSTSKPKCLQPMKWCVSVLWLL